MTTQKDFPFKVGDKARHVNWAADEYKEVLYIGNNRVFYRWPDGAENSDSFPCWDSYIPLEDE